MMFDVPEVLDYCLSPGGRGCFVDVGYEGGPSISNFLRCGYRFWLRTGVVDKRVEVGYRSGIHGNLNRRV